MKRQIRGGALKKAGQTLKKNIAALKAEYEAGRKKRKTAQDAYDVSTKHGTEMIEQERWEEEIGKELSD